ncbi:FtsK/SpoIIIE domain-containing protein [Natronosporangium hydrolyticum]|nr:FtsK/SpoIIIE domain-containing protein [Natronosporangium hydrolyticum]
MPRPFVGVVRGDRVPDVPPMMLQRPVMVRTPVVRVPLWLMAIWWCLKTLTLAVVVAVRWWWISAPVLALAGLWWRLGWPGPVAALVAVAGGLVAWYSIDRASFDKWCWLRLLSRWRRFTYRRRWWSAMSTAGLVVRFNGRELLPEVKKVAARRGLDVLLVRMVTGQIPEDFAKVSERFAHTFGVVGVRVRPHRKPGLVYLTMVRRDPLAGVVPVLPVASTPDFRALPLGVREDGQTYELRLFGTQVLVAGATGAGKGSVIWSFVRSLAGGVASGQVRLWGFDPKGGMELGPGLPLFAKFACEDYAAMADLLDQAVTVARERAARLRGHTRQHTPTTDEPLIVLVVDELAALTAYLADRKLKERIRAALGLLLTQGRAVGVHVLAALQDPRKEVLPFRDLFPTRIGLRLAESSQVDLVLGDGMRDRGAVCDQIPQALPGVGFVVLDGDPTPVRVRFSFLADDDIRDMAGTYRPGGVIDGHTVPPRKPRPGPASGPGSGAGGRGSRENGWGLAA